MKSVHILDRDDVTVSEFFAYDDENDNIYYELIDGRVYMQMRAKTGNYLTVLGNLLAIIQATLKKNITYQPLCNFKVYSKRNFYHVDIVVDGNPDIVDIYFIREPKLIIQGLSETRQRELNVKFSHYKNIDSLEEFAYFEPDSMGIYVFRRSDNWNKVHYKKGDNVDFESIGLTIPIAEIYDRILFDEEITAKKIVLARDKKGK